MRTLRAFVIAGLAVLVLAPSANAVKPLIEPFVNQPASFPAGVVCADFGVDLTIDVDAQTSKTFFDREGNPVRQLVTGRLVLTVTNADTGQSLTTRLGDAIHVIINADGSVTVIGTGNVLLFWFPTDVPAGPSATLYSGRIAFTVSPTGVGNFLSANGKAVDICAALAA
jgi:hypothetical protein